MPNSARAPRSAERASRPCAQLVAGQPDTTDPHTNSAAAGLDALLAAIAADPDAADWGRWAEGLIASDATANAPRAPP